jgi:hypothetical protein
MAAAIDEASSPNMTKDDARTRDDASPPFSRRLTWISSLVVRLVILIRILPPDLSVWIQSPALSSVIASPVFTLDQVREAMAIRKLVAPNRFVDAYHGRHIHMPVLLLSCLEPFVEFVSSEYWQHVVFGLFLLLVDFLIARTLEKLAKVLLQRAKDDGWEESLQRHMSQVIRPKLSHIFPIWTDTMPISDKQEACDLECEPLLQMDDLPFLVAQLYFASPVTALSSGAFDCVQNVRTLMVLFAILQVCQKSGSSVAAAFSLAAATYVEIHSAVFLVPVAIFLYEQKGQGPMSALVVLFVAFSVCLQGLSFLLVGSKDYLLVVLTTHGHVFQLAGIGPSLSVLWYFAMEVFQRFTRYFTIMLGGIPYLLVAPLTIRLYRYPIELVRTRSFEPRLNSIRCRLGFFSLDIFSIRFQATIFWLLWTLIRPIGTLYDLNVGFCLMLLSPRSLARMGSIRSLVSVCAISVPVLLYLVAYWMWLETGSGEANFLYFQCLAYNVFAANLVVDFCGACVKRDKALRLTQKGAKEGTAAENDDKDRSNPAARDDTTCTALSDDQ